MLIGTVDWALIEEWQDRKIPLRIVIAAIDEVFDRIVAKSDDPGRIKSLSYCKDAVESRFKTWQTTQAGKSRQYADAEVEVNNAPVKGAEKELRQHAEHVLERLRESKSVNKEPLATIVKQFSLKLDHLISNKDESDFEFALDDLDTSFDNELFGKRVEILPELADFEGSPRHVGTVIRQKYSIPRFSPFKL